MCHVPEPSYPATVSQHPHIQTYLTTPHNEITFPSLTLLPQPLARSPTTHQHPLPPALSHALPLVLGCPQPSSANRPHLGTERYGNAKLLPSTAGVVKLSGPTSFIERRFAPRLLPRLNPVGLPNHLVLARLRSSLVREHAGFSLLLKKRDRNRMAGESPARWVQGPPRLPCIKFRRKGKR